MSADTDWEEEEVERGHSPWKKSDDKETTAGAKAPGQERPWDIWRNSREAGKPKCHQKGREMWVEGGGPGCELCASLSEGRRAAGAGS